MRRPAETVAVERIYSCWQLRILLIVKSNPLISVSCNSFSTVPASALCWNITLQHGVRRRQRHTSVPAYERTRTVATDGAPGGCCTASILRPSDETAGRDSGCREDI